MALTHGYSIIGDGHTRGNKSGPPTLLDPVYGMLLATIGETQPAVVNTIVRGALAMARVTRVANVGVYEVEIFSDVLPVPLGAFVPGEALSYDSGGTATANLFVSVSAVQGPLGASTENAIQGRRDALFNSFLPDDGSDDPVFWDRSAKRCRSLVIASGWTGRFLPGDRITTSGGGAFTVWKYADAGGGTVTLWFIRASGSIAASQTLTNTTFAGSATVSSVAAATATGEWKRLSFLPNDNGLGTAAAGSVTPQSLYDLIPHGDGSDGKPGYGPMHTLLRKAQERWETDPDAANRHVRGFVFEAQDYERGSMGLLGGVIVQAIGVSGGAGTFTVGETVTSGTWSGKVHNKTATHMFVHTVNGNVLVASTTITGATSGATCTATTTAHGWQKGSLHYENLAAERTAALAATNANHSGTTRKEEGVLLQIWETELANFVTGYANSLTVTEALMRSQWEAFITSLRNLFGNATLPITIWQHDERSHPEITFFGLPWSQILRPLFATLSTTLTGVALTTSDGMEGASATALPYPTSLLWLRPDDYLEIGARAWRSLQFAATPVPAGQWRPIILFMLDGQSNMVGSKQSSIMGLDLDPDLWKSATFPGVSTIDVNVFQWNARPNVQAWENYDIAANGNPFFDQFGFSPVQAAIAQRMKRRFENEGIPADIGFIPLAVNGASVNVSSAAAVTLDPDAPARTTITAAQTVTVLGTIGSTLNPRRGRFTAGSAIYATVPVGQIVQVSGSALGFLGVGGNNHTAYAMASVYAVDVDNGTWIEIIGDHVVETATFTMTLGKYPAWPVQRDQIRKAIGACATQLQRVPVSKGIAYDQGESDLFNDAGQAGYEAALTRHLNAVLAEFGLETRGGTPPGIVVVRQTSRTPWGTDEQVAGIRAAQEAVVEAFENAAMVDSDSLQMEIEGAQWPRTTRQQNNVHRTLRALIDEGYLIDRAFSTLAGFPAHPDGEFVGADGGTDVGGGEGLGADSADGGADVEEPVLLSLVLEDGTAVPDAESYISVAQFRDMAQRIGNPTEVSEASDAQVQVWLRKSAREGVDMIYSDVLQGLRYTATQSLEWPRRGASDNRTQMQVEINVVPNDWKRAQFWYAYALAFGIDPMTMIDHADDSTRKRFATSWSEDLPGGLSESQTFAAGVPMRSIIPRMESAAKPFLLTGDDVAGAV